MKLRHRVGVKDEECTFMYSICSDAWHRVNIVRYTMATMTVVTKLRPYLCHLPRLDIAPLLAGTGWLSLPPPGRMGAP